MSAFDSLIGFLVDAGIAIGDLVGYIVDAIGYIKDGVIVLFEAILWLFKAPAYLISKLASFLPLLEPNADFTIDLGKMLVGCTDETSGGDDCVFNEDGSLREHGNGWFLKDFFYILKRFLQLPDPFPDLDWSMGGGGLIGGEIDTTGDVQSSADFTQDSKELESATENLDDGNIDVTAQTLPTNDYAVQETEKITSDDYEKNTKDYEISEKLKEEEKQKFSKDTEREQQKQKLMEHTLRLQKGSLTDILKRISLIDERLRSDGDQPYNSTLRTYYNFEEKDRKKLLKEMDEDIKKIESISDVKARKKAKRELDKKIKSKEKPKKYYRRKYAILRRTLRREKRDLTKRKVELETKAKNIETQNKRDIIYSSFIRVLVRIVFNPIDLIAKVINGIIYLVNKTLEYVIVKPLELIITGVMLMCEFLLDTLISVLKIVVNEVLKPLGGIISKVKVIPVSIYKCFTWIADMGIVKFIFYGMYAMIHNYTGDFLPHLATILLAVFIIIILVVCPYIGLSTQFGSFMSMMASFGYNIVFFVYNLYRVITVNIKFYLEKKLIENDLSSIIELFEDLYLNMNEKGEDLYEYINEKLFSEK